MALTIQIGKRLDSAQPLTHTGPKVQYIWQTLGKYIYIYERELLLISIVPLLALLLFSTQASTSLKVDGTLHRPV